MRWAVHSIGPCESTKLARIWIGQADIPNASNAAFYVCYYTLFEQSS